jgi:RhtB (resistance to homoserine/threonine) family protein
MEYLPLIGTVFFLNLLGAISPGPDFIMTVKNSIRYSRRSGIFTGLGIGLGLAIHIIYCAAGVGYLISKSIILFSIIKFLGAGYLIYIGVVTFLSKGTNIEIAEDKTIIDLTRFQAFKIGFLTNVLNPKATLFFLSLFTFVINHDTPWYIVLIISAMMILTAIVWFTLVAVFLTQKRVIKAFSKFEYYLNKFFGGLLIAIGLKIAFTLK